MIRTAKLFFWADRALYLGMGFEAEPHTHHAVQICISLEDSFSVRTSENQPWRQFQSVLIHADVPHQFMGLGQELAVLYIDYEARDAKAIREQLSEESGIVEIPYAQALNSIHTFQSNLEEKHNLHELYTTCDKVVESICDSKKPVPQQDERIVAIINMLNSYDGDRISVQEIAEQYGLSLGRLAHLFKEQVGLPVRRYFLWRKILRAIQSLEQVSTLTEAAHLAGFADSSHMNRTFKQMFGIKPSFFQTHSKFVQVISF